MVEFVEANYAMKKAVSFIRTLVVKSNDEGQRIDKFLQKTLNNIPQSLLCKYFRKKCIKINGKRAQMNDLLCAGDEIKLFISDEFFEKSKDNENHNFKKDTCTLKQSEIIYEDENIIILDKPAGELVHSGSFDAENKNADQICLADRLLGYLYKKGEYNPEDENCFAPALCNRLDRNTCGLVIAAKNAKALRIMNQKIKDREMQKLYRTVVYGAPPENEDTLTDFWYKDKENNRVFIFPTRQKAKEHMHIKYDDDIKTVITKYKVLKKTKDKSLLEIDLITGRTHQIRAHLAYIGCAIVGDGKYGKNHKSKTKEKYQLLCSHKLKFDFKTPSDILQYLDKMEFESKNDVEL